MICEMCGKDCKGLKVVEVEGTTLNVCPECAKFGKQKATPVGIPTAPVTPQRVMESLERREKRGQQKDIFEQITEELVDDYAERVREARVKKGWTPEELGKKINERKTVITKIEAGEMTPTEDLTRRLQAALGIKLLEKPTQILVRKNTGARPLTLGDLIKAEMDKKK